MVSVKTIGYYNESVVLWSTISFYRYWFTDRSLYHALFNCISDSLFVDTRSDDIMSDDAMYAWIAIGVPFLIYAFYLVVTK